MVYKKIITPVISAALLFSAAAPVYAQPKVENEEVSTSNVVSQDEFTYNFQGVTNEVRTIEDDKSLTTTIKTDKGMEVFTTDKATGHISVTSDHLNKMEISAYEESVNDIASQLDSQLDDSTITGNQFNILKPTKENFSIQKRVGKWYWSKWDKVTIRVEDKATVTIITAAILSRIPYIGWVAGAAASIIINYKMKTGYFKVRGASALDSDPNYGWMKKRVQLFKDKKRKKKLSDKTSSPTKVRMY
ncbi:hypothetical protein OZL46_14070 [Bacillus sonorensis]|uniref:hypothetical protein n=1 Tax=Bacillus sonorensis TaxID=119858 RepID=UPI002281F5DF|nr:hypothetical protein [Bacillus sonorensis]MCY8087233.1 hypothetical protein [Bacillus sonorensis]MCZ0069551.1 hypothetical protein [Bacillus sonorensis]MCZ0096940.1 hypothetical protein [Bacillus sonorensis]MEC1517618.1 hypothetical protein [Bacillus sonorensis]